MPVEQITDTKASVVATIKRVAQSQQADFSYLLTQAKVESGLNPTARAGTSSATGLYQFTSGTWLNVVKRHGDSVGLNAQAQALRSATLSADAKNQLLSLRNEPEIATRMAAHLAVDNARALSAAGHDKIGPTELYLAHFLGSGGATTFLNGMRTTPDMPAAGSLSAAAAANTPVFYDQGRPRSYREIYDRFAQKFNTPATATTINTLAQIKRDVATGAIVPSDATPSFTNPSPLTNRAQQIKSAVNEAMGSSQQQADGFAIDRDANMPITEEALTRYLGNFGLVDHSKGLINGGAREVRDASQAARDTADRTTGKSNGQDPLTLGANLILKATAPEDKSS